MAINDKYLVGQYLKDQLKYAKKGMLKPEIDKLKVGHYYYRIGHSNNPVSPSKDEIEKAFSSSWWMDFETLKKIMIFSETNNVSLTIDGRIKNAVAPKYGKSNMLIRGLLSKPAKALIGAGRPIESDGAVFFLLVILSKYSFQGYQTHYCQMRYFRKKIDL